MACKSGIRVGLTILIVGALLLTMPVSPNRASSPDEINYYLVTFSELPSDSQKEALTLNIHASFQEYWQNNTFLMRVPISHISTLSSLPFVYSLRQYLPEDKLSPELAGLSGPVSLIITLHPDSDLTVFESAMKALGATIGKTNAYLVNYIECTVDASEIQRIARMLAVNTIQPNGEKRTHMNLITSNTYIGNDAAQTGGFRGQGMLAEVQDNGCERTHPDLTNVLYTDGSVVVDSHGTCTTGIVFGTGAGLATAQGIAYQATGVFADWGTGRTVSIQNLWNGNFNQGSAGMNGVVQSNSWSQGGLDGRYTSYTNQDDAASYNNPRVLSLWAVGNANDGTGIGLISQDSASKNGMGIGAIWHQNTASMSDDDYHSGGVGNTPSRGPAADGRMKPDLIAAFDYIYTVDRTGSNGYASGDYYSNFGGTSGATPIVAGSAIQAYQMYKEDFFGNNPTNALPYSCTIKALMIADAYQYPLGVNDITRNVQGWGAPDMENMYNLGADYHVIEEYPQALSSGSTWSRSISSDGTKPLKVSVAWIDPAAPAGTGAGVALINNLDLKVTSPTGTVYWGNNGLWDNLYSSSGTGANTWSTSGGYRDDKNNVENVFIQNPQAGMWTVEVSGRVGGVPSGPQHFSMVASGAQDATVASATGPIGTSNSASVTLTYTTMMTPTSVELYYTKNGGTSWSLAGTDFTVDGSFPYTITAGDGTYGWYARAIGGGSIETAPTGGTPPEAASYILDTVPPAAPTGLTVHHWGPAADMKVETRYMRGVVDEASVNGITTYLLGTEQSTTQQLAGSGNRGTVYAGIRVWKVNSAGTEAEITSGSAVATVSTGATGLVTGTWSCPQTTLEPTDSIAVRVYQDNTGALTTQRAEFTTEQLGATQLETATWSVQYYLIWAVQDRFGWGTSIYDSKISNFAWSIGSDPLYHNTLNWSHSGTDVDHYNIYRSDAQVGTYNQIDSVPVGTNTYCDIDRGQFDATLWWYRVRAEDAAGNEEANTNSVQEPGSSEQPYHIPIAATGWRFVSFPYDFSGNIQTVLDDMVYGGGGTTWSVAKGWDNAAKKWLTYRAGYAATLSTIDNTMGVWLYVTATDGTLTTSLEGDFPAGNVVIQLYTGWNMVGYPSATNRPASATLPAQADMVATYQDMLPYIIDRPPSEVTFSHGNAYWVRVTADCTWTVNP